MIHEDGSTGYEPEEFRTQEYSPEETTQIIADILAKMKRGGKIPDDLNDLELSLLHALSNKLDNVGDLLGLETEQVLKKLGAQEEKGGGQSFLDHIRNMFARRN